MQFISFVKPTELFQTALSIITAVLWLPVFIKDGIKRFPIIGIGRPSGVKISQLRNHASAVHLWRKAAVLRVLREP
jgi:hypothetical protein